MKQKINRFFFIFSGIAVFALNGCSATGATVASASSNPQSTAVSTEGNDSTIAASQMIFAGGTCLISSGRTAPAAAAGLANGQITEVVSSDKTPSVEGQANFDCLGASYTILADGAAALELSGDDILFLADDTVEYEGVFKKKKDLSDDTLTWLDFYDSLSDDERLALSIVPSEFADELRAMTGQDDRSASLAAASAAETTRDALSYIDALTEDELTETENLIQTYFTEETPYYEGVDQLYPVDSDYALYQNTGLEAEYEPGNIIIYKVLTVRDRCDGNPFRSVSVARSNKSSDWKIINSGY
ncbi:MAG: hypothetical protein LUE65_08175 [Clostridiales bacterium]|nr:hypothetical protein [Clostridiales bacterium]